MIRKNKRGQILMISLILVFLIGFVTLGIFINTPPVPDNIDNNPNNNNTDNTDNTDNLDNTPKNKLFTCYQCVGSDLGDVALVKLDTWSCRSEGGVLYTNTKADCELLHPEYFETGDNNDNNPPTTKTYSCYTCEANDLGSVSIIKEEGWSCRELSGTLYTSTQAQCELLHPEYFNTGNNDNTGDCSGYLSTSNGNIINSCGQEVNLYGLSWFGFELPDNAFHGLWAQSMDTIVTTVNNAGFNTIRVPLSIDNIAKEPAPKTINYNYNPNLQGLSSFQVLDEFVDMACEKDMYVVLDFHRIYPTYISELWYEGDYTEQQVIQNMKKIATRYKNKPCVIGIDLKNEPWGKVTWGSGDVNTDWAMASNRLGKAMHEVNPEWIIFVGGIDNKNHEYGTFWGEYVGDISLINLPANKVVYAPHAYGPDVWNMDYFSASNFPSNMPVIWDSHFTNNIKSGGGTIVIGEFGGTYTGQDKVWQDAFISYMNNRGIDNFIYWSLNPNSGDTKGILLDDWKTIDNNKLTLLKRVMEK